MPFHQFPRSVDFASAPAYSEALVLEINFQQNRFTSINVIFLDFENLNWLEQVGDKTIQVLAVFHELHSFLKHSLELMQIHSCFSNRFSQIALPYYENNALAYF